MANIPLMMTGRTRRNGEYGHSPNVMDHKNDILSAKYQIDCATRRVEQGH
jgi:hypothetical protein